MDRKDIKLQEENIATREKGLAVVREFDRVVRAFNKILEDTDDRAKSIEADLQGLGKTLKKNLDSQYEIDRNFEVYDNNLEKIILNLQHLEDEEETHSGQYERLLNGVGIEGDSQDLEEEPANDAMSAENENQDIDTLEILRKRREKFLKNLNQEFKSLEEKLVSINKLREELEKSRNDISDKKVQTFQKKKALEEEGIKLLNEVDKLERELETTLLEEEYLIEESVKLIERVESSLELDDKIDEVLFSSLALDESNETSPASKNSDNGHKVAIGT